MESSDPSPLLVPFPLACSTGDLDGEGVGQSVEGRRGFKSRSIRGGVTSARTCAKSVLNFIGEAFLAPGDDNLVFEVLEEAAAIS